MKLLSLIPLAPLLVLPTRAPVSALPMPPAVACHDCLNDFDYADHWISSYTLPVGYNGAYPTSSHTTHNGSYWPGFCNTHQSCGWVSRETLDSVRRALVAEGPRAALRASESAGLRLLVELGGRSVVVLGCGGDIVARISG